MRKIKYGLNEVKEKIRNLKGQELTMSINREEKK